MAALGEKVDLVCLVSSGVGLACYWMGERDYRRGQIETWFKSTSPVRPRPGGVSREGAAPAMQTGD
jgi:hypothetical protein